MSDDMIYETKTSFIITHAGLFWIGVIIGMIAFVGLIASIISFVSDDNIYAILMAGVCLAGFIGNLMLALENSGFGTKTTERKKTLRDKLLENDL